MARSTWALLGLALVGWAVAATTLEVWFAHGADLAGTVEITLWDVDYQ